MKWNAEVNEPCVVAFNCLCPSVRHRILSYLLITRARLRCIWVARCLDTHDLLQCWQQYDIKIKKKTIHHIDGRRARNRTHHGTKEQSAPEETRKRGEKKEGKSIDEAKREPNTFIYYNFVWLMMVCSGQLIWPVRGRTQDFYLCVTMDEMNGCAALERVKHHFHDYSLTHLLNGRTNRSHETNALHGHVEWQRANMVATMICRELFQLICEICSAGLNQYSKFLNKKIESTR